jgi:hypothetical protein
MTIHRRALAAGAAAMLLAFSTTASAQRGPTRHQWSHGTMLSVLAGAAHDGSRTGAIAGTGIGWEVLPWFGVEGNGTWLDRGARTDAFAADLRALVGLPRSGALVPFVAGGVGLYRSTLDRGASVTDPSLVIGGGLNLFLTQHAALRPEVASTFVIGDTRTRAVTAVAVRLTYHFEDHPITPSR